MNQVTQQNATISESSTSASTEIHSEIIRIRNTIREVEGLVDGGKSSDSKHGDYARTAVLHNGAVHQPKPAAG